MVTRSIVGRFLILAILIVAVGVAAQTALILTDSGKKATKTASAVPAVPSKPAEQAAPAAADAVRVVYPGPLGEVPASRPKLADTASASPLAGPAPQTTAKLALAMSAPAAGTPAPPIPAPASAAAPSLGAPASTATVPAPAPAPLSPPAPAQTAADPHAKPTAPTPTGVEVASLGSGAPQADVSPGGSLNINTASVDAMNHLGGGHIGESIVKHRPYQSVEDLVKKRVLRRSVYNQIKDQLAAQ